jgi:mycoredoxin
VKKFRYFVIFSVLALLCGCLESSREAPTTLSEKYGEKVVMYATSWCGYCQRMREFFAANNIDYQEYDVEASSEGMREFKDLGGKGVPLVLVKGRVVEGYAPKAVAKLLKSN